MRFARRWHSRWGAMRGRGDSCWPTLALGWKKTRGWWPHLWSFQGLAARASVYIIHVFVHIRGRMTEWRAYGNGKGHGGSQAFPT